MKTHHSFEHGNVSEALPVILAAVLSDGEEVGSRQGERTREILMPRIALWRPWEREILVSGRKPNLAAQIAETMWVLAGRNDIEWLGHYLPRAVDFSDDGTTWTGGYGPRLRKWPQFDGTGWEGIDQLDRVVNLLKNERGTRRAVMAIYDPSIDSVGGKDIPCNDFLTFISRGGKLHMSVTTRSNDVMWGWSGINQFEWSVLQEIVAYLTGNQIGTLTFNVTSMHLYEKHWDKAARIVNDVTPTYGDVGPSTRFEPEERSVGYLDDLIKKWFEVELGIRSGGTMIAAVNAFPEPMMRSWLRVLQWYWSGDMELLKPLKGARLYVGTQYSTAPKKEAKPLTVPVVQYEPDNTVVGEVPPELYDLFANNTSGLSMVTTDVHGHEKILPIDEFVVQPRTDPGFISTRGLTAPLAWLAQFIEYTDQLHREKSAVYGDSWKKRGEQISILANIARKIDRLGVDGAGDSAADTVIDLLVYLIKYRLWINDNMGVNPSIPPEHENDAVRAILEQEDRTVPKVVQRASMSHRFTAITTYFGELEKIVGVKVNHQATSLSAWVARADIVDAMIRLAFPAARLLWGEENGHILKPEQAAELLINGSLDEANATARRAVVQEANKARRWEGYEAGENID